MSQSTTQNRRWVLASRPHGAPVAENFRLEEQPIPTPAEGQVLLRTVWHAWPYERCPILFTSCRDWRGDGGRHGKPRRDLPPSGL